MTNILLLLISVLLAGSVALLVILFKRTSRPDASLLSLRLTAFEKAQERTDKAVRDEADRSRRESAEAARDQRQELTASFKTFGETIAKRVGEVSGAQKEQFEIFDSRLGFFVKTNADQFGGVRTEYATASKQLREEVVTTLKSISDTMSETMGEMAKIHNVRLESMESRLKSMQDDNASQLDQIRKTVEEKLQGTLEKRLGDSFKQVSDRLEQVHKGLGEMQTLASGVGDLKKVLTNVKTRGVWGEAQLGALLDQVLSPDQYAANVETGNNGERVEFAIKLPGQGENNEKIVWLPVDAKFPLEDYHRLVEAQDRADANEAEAAGKQLENRVKNCAKDINIKYLNPPATTDFGVMFLPTEGLYAEVARRTGLVEFIQREHRVAIAGPTTLWAILNSLQMGFRTLAIQKRSSEVWSLLAAVKTEWTKYGDILDQVHKKLSQASETIERAKARSRVVGKKLRDVQELPFEEASSLLPEDVLDDEEDAPMPDAPVTD